MLPISREKSPLLIPPQTPRLCLRELDPSGDAGFLLEVLNEPAFLRNVGDRGVRTEADAARYIRERIVPQYEKFGFGMWLVQLKATHDLVAICGLIKRDTLADVDVGFSVLERFRWRGYGFEAASATIQFGWKVVKLSRVVAITAPHNTQSIRLLEKLGLCFEKLIRLTPDAAELMLYAASVGN